MTAKGRGQAAERTSRFLPRKAAICRGYRWDRVACSPPARYPHCGHYRHWTLASLARPALTEASGDGAMMQNHSQGCSGGRERYAGGKMASVEARRRRLPQLGWNGDRAVASHCCSCVPLPFVNTLSPESTGYAIEGGASPPGILGRVWLQRGNECVRQRFLSPPKLARADSVRASRATSAPPKTTKYEGALR